MLFTIFAPLSAAELAGIAAVVNEIGKMIKERINERKNLAEFLILMGGQPYPKVPENFLSGTFGILET